MLPETFCDLKRIDLQIVPPGSLIAGLMQLSVMAAAQRYGELITHLETDRPRLRKPQVMGSDGCRPQTRQGWEATNFRCALSRRRFGSAMASWLLSILAGNEVGPCWRQGRRRCVVFPCFCLIPAKQFSHRALVAPPVVMRRPRDRRRVIGVQTDRGCGGELRWPAERGRRSRMPFLSFR